MNRVQTGCYEFIAIFPVISYISIHQFYVHFSNHIKIKTFKKKTRKRQVAHKLKTKNKNAFIILVNQPCCLKILLTYPSCYICIEEN